MPSVSRHDVDVLQAVTRDLLAVAMTSVHDTTDVSMPQMRLLLAVHDAGHGSCGEIAHALGVAGSTVTRLADRLVSAGYLDRVHNPDNRSVVLLSLTDAGLETVNAVLSRRAAMFRRALRGLDSSARAQLVSGLDVLHTALDEIVASGLGA